MNKAELVEALAAASGVEKKSVDAVIKALPGVITAALKAEEKVQIAGFGTFEVSERDAHEGINPKTKEKITIAAVKVPKFKAGKTLKDSIN